MMRKHAVLVGIDRCNDATITPLVGAANDTRRLAGFLEDRLRFNQVRALTDDDLRRGEDVIETLSRSLETLAEGDLLLFFFAGHGKSVKDAKGKHDQIFLLHNANRISLDKGFFSSFTLSLGHIEAITQKMGVRRLFIFDTCRLPIELELAENRDGELPLQFDGEEIYRDLTRRAPLPSTEMVDSPVTILNACANGQRAVEVPGERRGLYALTLQDAWASELESGRPLCIDARFDQLLDNTMDKVARRFNVRRGSQTPVRVGPDLQLFGKDERSDQEMLPFLAAFDAQLQASKLDSPVGDNCRDTLNVLISKGLPREQQQALAARLQQALDARRALQDREHDERLIEHARRYPNAANFSAYLVQNRLGEHVDEAKQFLDAQDQSRQESEAWAAARRSDLPADYQSYLDRFPDGLNSGFARQRLEELAALSVTEGKRQRDDERRTEAGKAADPTAAWQEVLASAETEELRNEAEQKVRDLQEAERQAAENARLNYQRQLLADFDKWLKAGQLDKPEGECCTATLALLQTTMVSSRKLQELTQRLESAYDEQAYADAKRVNSEEAYQGYLDSHPKGKFRNGARICIDKLHKAAAERFDNDLFIKAKLAGTIEALENYKRQSKTKGRVADADALLNKLRGDVNALEINQVSCGVASASELVDGSDGKVDSVSTSSDETSRLVDFGGKIFSLIEKERVRFDFILNCCMWAVGLFVGYLYYPYANNRSLHFGHIITASIVFGVFPVLVVDYLKGVFFSAPVGKEAWKLTSVIKSDLVNGSVDKNGVCVCEGQSLFVVRGGGKEIVVIPLRAISYLQESYLASLASEDRRTRSFVLLTLVFSFVYATFFYSFSNFAFSYWFKLLEFAGY